MTCAIFIATDAPLKGIASLLLGLAINCIGIDPAAGHPRFTFGSVELLQGISFIPAMIGMFAVSELMRGVVTIDQGGAVLTQKIGNIFVGVWNVWRRYWRNFIRGSAIGVLIGALPGAGADIAAWISYAVSKKFSKEPEKFGTGHIEGIVDATSANNSALGGAWIPALVFGIPGDSITAIVIGVLYMKGMNPGPTVFLQNPQFIYAVFLIFILANLLMLPLGWAAIKSSKQILRVPRNILIPVILLFCIVGSYAMTNSIYGVIIMLVMGVLGWIMEENGFPIAPAILGLVLGEMLEQNFMTSMIKSDGAFLAFFERPIAGVLGVTTLLVWAAHAVARHQPFDRPGRAKRLSERDVVVLPALGSIRGTAGPASVPNGYHDSRCRERHPRTGPKSRAAKVRRTCPRSWPRTPSSRHHGRPASRIEECRTLCGDGIIKKVGPNEELPPRPIRSSTSPGRSCCRASSIPTTTSTRP